MDLRGRFIGPNPVFEDQTVCTLQDSSTRVLVNTLKHSYENYYQNTFSGLDTNIDRKQLAMFFLDSVICYIRGVDKKRNQNYSNLVLPHSITNPILNALLETESVTDDLIYVFCIQANVSFTELKISQNMNRRPEIFETLKQFNLQKLDLSSCTFLDSPALHKITTSNSIKNSLVSLNIRGCTSVKTLPHLGSLRALKVLDISEIPRLGMRIHRTAALLDKLCTLLAQLPRLKSLSCHSNGILDSMNVISNDAANNQLSESIILSCKLESLDISLHSWRQQIIDPGIPEFLKYLAKFPDLETLDISGWYITSQAFYNAFSQRRPFKFLGLLNIPAFIEATTFSKYVTYYSEEVTSLSTLEQILNSLNVYYDCPSTLHTILGEIKFWLENYNLNLDKDFVSSYTEVFLKILNNNQPDWDYPTMPIVGVVISCLSMITTQFGEDITDNQRDRVMKNCLIQYQHMVPNKWCKKITEEIINIVTTFITPDLLGREDWFPFYIVMLKFVLNLMRQENNGNYIFNQTPRSALVKQHSQFLTLFTIEMSRRYQAMVGIDHGAIWLLSQQIYQTVTPGMGLLMNSNVNRIENLWGALRNLAYLCPENCNQFLLHIKWVMPSCYTTAKNNRWQEVVNIIHQTLENVIECWCLSLIEIGDYDVLCTIEDILKSMIYGLSSDNDEESITSTTTTVIYLARMFERINRHLPGYLADGLDLVAEIISTCGIVHRVKRKCLRALLDCALSRFDKIVRSASWLVNNYLDQDHEHYSRLVEEKLREDQTEVIVIDD